jgi:7-carboxy-7-deazaguanine synthase
MTYSIKEIFYTLQGEGIRAGRPSVFCRFTGCNLWSGRVEDRATAICNFCDTDFLGTDGTLGGKFSDAKLLAQTINSLWPTDKSNKYVVLTGGEPLLQVNSQLIDALHYLHFEIAVETNGTITVPDGIDWICVSPKVSTNWVQREGQELKLIYPQPQLMPSMVEEKGFDYYLLQPMDGANKINNTNKAIEFCKNNPKWRLSIQTHKLLEIR